MEKPQLVNFIANILEDSGFKVYKNFKTTQQIVDIYAVLPTSMGDFALVVACKNYDKEWTVGIDVLKEMEMVGKNLKASKVCIITSSKFSEQATKYAGERHIKLVDRNGLIKLAKKYKNKKKEEEAKAKQTEITNFYDYYTPSSNSQNDYYEREDNVDRDYVYDDNADYSDYEVYDDNVDYRDYSIYDDNRYRAQYLVNKSHNQGTLNRNLSRTRSPKPSLRRGRTQNQTNYTTSRRSLSNKRQFNQPNNQRDYYGQIMKQQDLIPTKEVIKKYLKNPVIDIIIVVVISYLIAALLGGLVKIPTGYLGLTELIVALVLSYGIVFYSDRDNKDPLIKGTVIFFISLIVLMLLIILI